MRGRRPGWAIPKRPARPSRAPARRATATPATPTTWPRLSTVPRRRRATWASRSRSSDARPCCPGCMAFLPGWGDRVAGSSSHSTFVPKVFGILSEFDERECPVAARRNEEILAAGRGQEPFQPIVVGIDAELILQVERGLVYPHDAEEFGGRDEYGELELGLTGTAGHIHVV